AEQENTDSFLQMASAAAVRHVVDERRFLRGDGGVVWVRINMYVHPGGRGQAAHLIAVFEDITERCALTTQVTRLVSKLEEKNDELAATVDRLMASEERFQQMAANIRDVFFLIEAGTNRLLYVSPSYEAIWGRSRENLYEHPE